MAWTFTRLGCLSFGGPVAHLGYLQRELVERRGWVDHARYAELVALCQFLPGPASSQVVFALGMQRAGLGGALLASVCFTLPSALAMLGFAAGVARAGDLSGAGWLRGLKVAAVAVVAQAVWSMARKLCTGVARATICLLAATALLVGPGALAQLSVLALGGLAGVCFLHEAGTSRTPGPQATARAHLAAAGALSVFAALLALLPVAATVTGSRDVAAFDAFYRAGSLVFGGGHVVLPLLRAELVPRGWLSDDQFLAGYGAAQALPGPLFALAAYLGAAMDSGRAGWVSGLGCLVAIFLPAWLLVGGALPFWQRLRAAPWAGSALAGANAAVVGVLLAALVNPVVAEGIRGPKDAAAAFVALVALQRFGAPAWLIVGAMAAAGQWAIG